MPESKVSLAWCSELREPGVHLPTFTFFGSNSNSTSSVLDFQHNSLIPSQHLQDLPNHARKRNHRTLIHHHKYPSINKCFKGLHFDQNLHSATPPSCLNVSHVVSFQMTQVLWGETTPSGCILIQSGFSTWHANEVSTIFWNIFSYDVEWPFQPFKNSHNAQQVLSVNGLSLFRG